MTMKYFLGLDIGGTKTACVLADEHGELCRARAGSAKVLRIGKAEAAMHLKEVLDEVSEKGGVALAEVTASCIGTSGAAVPEVTEWLREHMAKWVGGSLSLLGDEIITLDAAFPGEPGVVVIAGTGSNVIGRGRDGKTTGAGGWGPALADEGSGNLLGQQALRNAFAAVNAGEEPLGNRIIELPKAPERAELRDSRFGFIAHVPRGSIARGKALVTSGEKTAPCSSCHGSDLRGSGDIPPLIGRSPSYLFRQLNDIKIGARTGPHVDPMRQVAVLDDSEMIAIAAYLAAQRP